MAAAVCWAVPGPWAGSGVGPAGSLSSAGQGFSLSLAPPLKGGAPGVACPRVWWAMTLPSQGPGAAVARRGGWQPEPHGGCLRATTCPRLTWPCGLPSSVLGGWSGRGDPRPATRPSPHTSVSTGSATGVDGQTRSPVLAPLTLHLSTGQTARDSYIEELHVGHVWQRLCQAPRRQDGCSTRRSTAAGGGRRARSSGGGGGRGSEASTSGPTATLARACAANTCHTHTPRPGLLAGLQEGPRTPTSFQENLPYGAGSAWVLRCLRDLSSLHHLRWSRGSWPHTPKDRLHQEP